jgi:hypothetical protein
MAEGGEVDETVALSGISEQELDYCLNIIKQSGKFQLIPIAESTPVVSKEPKFDTPTPVREHRQGLRFQSEDVPNNACKEHIPSKVHSLKRYPSVVESPNPYHDVSGYAFVPRVHDKAMVQPPDYIPNRPPPPSRAALYSAEPIPLNASHVAHFSAPRVPKLPEFDGNETVDCAFDMWRYDVNCLIRNQVYPDHVILEAIRKSLKGKARTVLLHLGEGASVFDILIELEGIYGNVATGEKLKEQFYCARQEPNESVADYSVRLEHLLCQTNLYLDKDTKNDMLRNRLWSGLRDSQLRNISRYKYELVRDFSVLRRELRQMEQELEVSRRERKQLREETGRSTLQKAEPVTQCMSAVESKLLQQLQEITGQLKQLNTRVSTLEKNNVPNSRSNFKNPANQKTEASGKGSQQSDKPLNSSRPPQKGQ